MKLKPFKKEKLNNKQKKILIALSSLCFIFLFIAIYQSFAAYNIKHSERIVDSKVGSMYDVRSMAIFIDGEPQPNMTDFPTDKIFSHVRCYVDGEFRENITGVWENDSLTIKPFTSKTNCNVYFIDPLLRNRVIIDNGGETAIVARGLPDYSRAAVSQRIYDQLRDGISTNISDHDGKHTHAIPYNPRENYEVSNGLFKTSSTIPGWVDNNQGMFSGTSASHEGGDSYYFRGDVRNNFVRFAGFWWRIVRVEGNGNIRLIYNGTLSGNNPPLWAGEGISIGTGAFNSTLTDNRHVGFKHGTTCATYATCHANTTNSTVLNNLNNWYTNNIVNKGTTVTSRIATNTIFCGDRNLASGTGVATSNTMYGTIERLIENRRPSLQCINRTGHVPQNHDQYGISGTGNGSLSFPVGLISADETALAGSVRLLLSGDVWIAHELKLTINPAAAAATNVSVTHSVRGTFQNNPTNTPAGVRPVISLRSDTLIISGNGTRDNPYIIN